MRPPSNPQLKKRLKKRLRIRLWKYTLLSKMNLRLAPSLKGGKVGIAEGTVVEVIGIENDWMELKDGMFILYGGKYAERI